MPLSEPITQGVEKDYLLAQLLFEGAHTISDGLMRVVADNPGLYDIYTMREKMEPKLRNTRSIYLRRPRNFTQLEVRATTDTAHLLECENTRIWSMFNPYIDDFIARLKAEFGITKVGRAFITKLLPGSRIDPHIDFGDYFRYYHRFHFPLLAAPGCSFSVEAVRHELEVGQLYVMNNCRMHSVENPSGQERVHLIVDAA